MSYTYDYERAGLTADVVLFYIPTHILVSDFRKNDVEVLLINRNKNPYKNHWAIPGGFMEINETLEDAGIREVKEEVGITVDNLIQVGVYDSIGRNAERVVSVAFMGILNHKQEPIADEDEVSVAKWINLSKVSQKKPAFDHKDMINDAYEKIRELVSI